MMASKIEQTIADIENFIDSCKFKSFSNTQIIVDKEEIETLISELKKRVPEEIKYYQKIITNREAIINDAKAKAEELISQATIQTSELISQHEIMLRAYEEADIIVTQAIDNAQNILDQATEEANELKTQAIMYTDGLLADVENIVGHYIGTTNNKYEEMMNGLNNCYDIVRSNRQELIDDAVEDNGIDVEEILADDTGDFAMTEPGQKTSARPSDDDVTSDEFWDIDSM